MDNRNGVQKHVFSVIGIRLGRMIYFDSHQVVPIRQESTITLLVVNAITSIGNRDVAVRLVKTII